MTRTMYDGVDSDAAAIGRQARPGDLVAGYVDGLYKWSPADWACLGVGVIRVRIAVFASTNDGHILDCERGDATPAQSVDWVLMRRAAGADPTVYMNTGTWPTVRGAFLGRGVPEPHYWVAQYDGDPTIPAGAIGKQYADNIRLQQPWDISVVADYWPGVDPAPAPAPHLVLEDDMLIIRSITGSSEIWAQVGGKYWHVATPGDLNAYVSKCRAAAVPVVELEVSAAEHANLRATA